MDCNGCTMCCKWLEDEQRPALMEDEIAQFEHTQLDDGTVVIATKEDSPECFYLEDNGCRIHSFAPKVCKEYDCRQSALAVSPATLHYANIIVKGMNMMRNS